MREMYGSELSYFSVVWFDRGTYFKSDKQKTDSDDGFLIVKSDFNPEASILQQLVLR